MEKYEYGDVGEAEYDICNVVDKVIAGITRLELDVYVYVSDHSESRYLEVDAEGKHYVIRISDHSLPQGRCNFDIYVGKQRKGAWHYRAFIGTFSRIVRKKRKLGKVKKAEGK